MQKYVNMVNELYSIYYTHTFIQLSIEYLFSRHVLDEFTCKTPY